MLDSDDWIFRPMLAGLCSYLDVAEGRVGILDIAVMNEALDVRAENEWRAMQAAEKESKHGRH